MAFRLWNQINSVKYLQHGSLKPYPFHCNSSLISTPEFGTRSYSDSRDYRSYRALKGRLVRHASDTSISEDDNLRPSIRYHIIQGTDLVAKNANRTYKSSNISHIKHKLADKTTPVSYEDTINAMRKEFHRQQSMAYIQPCSMKPFCSKETRCFEMEGIPSGKFMFGTYPRRGMATKADDKKSVKTAEAKEAKPSPETLSVESENVTIPIEDIESMTKTPSILIEEEQMEVESIVSSEPIESIPAKQQLDDEIATPETTSPQSIKGAHVEVESIESSEPIEPIQIKQLDHVITKPVLTTSPSIDEVLVEGKSIESSEEVEPMSANEQESNELVTPISSSSPQIEEASVDVKSIGSSEQMEPVPSNPPSDNKLGNVTTLSPTKTNVGSQSARINPTRGYSTSTRRSKAKRLPIKTAQECKEHMPKKKRKKVIKHDADEPWVKCECCPELLPCDQTTYVNVYPFPCPNVDYPEQSPGEFKKPPPPPIPTQMPVGRLVKRPVLQKINDDCGTDCIDQVCYYVEPKALREFPKERCPCVEPYIPDKLPAMRYVKKHIYQCIPQCSSTRCERPKYITQQKKLPDIIPGDCPPIEPTYTDTAPLQRLDLSGYQEVKEKCASGCIEKPIPRLIEPKCLPRFRNDCVCIEPKPLKPVKMVRLPHICVCPRPPDPKCIPDKGPLRADDICKWKFRTKKLKNWWCPNPKLPKPKEFCSKSRKLKENIQ